MDIRLKGAIDGAAQEVRMRFDIPIIFLTAYTDHDTQKRAESMAPHGFLNKQFKANELYQRACIECIRIHGAVGFTKELDLGLYYLRSKAAEHTMGDTPFHREIIAGELENYQAPI